ncbi:MAG: hypothetical protein C5B51_29070 [Terriglobia bacterium]|nr:MAG: hypothetical protein C5B51_29070 [Terriglobia bacterium]
MKRILLVTPDKTPDTGYAQMLQNRERLQGPATKLRAVMAPVELATLAAVTPPEFEVDCWDEAVRGKITPDTDLGKDYDIMGVTGYLAHVVRMLEICREFRRRAVLTVAGGPAVSGSPERFRGVFDVIFLGEAEYTWPQFLREFAEGKHISEYRQIERPDIADSPIPRWDLIQDVDTAYVTGGVQTTRGCPFDCEFCDVIHLFGRRPRHKPISAVLEEIKTLEKLGVKRIFFCDDNFYGNPKYMKELLRELIPLNNSFDRPIGYMTQITINVAKDEEALQLLSEANFWQLHIGIETPRKASLMEVNKFQNTKGDMVEDILKIQSYGVMIKSLMMVGFDHDDATIFDELYNFLQASCIPSIQLSLLQSYPGTPQTARLLKEGRVIDMDRYAEMDETYGVSNVIPKLMTREELFEGFLALEERLRSWKAFGERLLGAIRAVKYTPACAAKVTRPDPNRLMEIQGMIQSLEPDARDVAREVIRETLQSVPWLAPKVLYKLVLQVDKQRALDRMRRRLHKRLDIEKQPGYQHRILATVQIPRDFKKIYRDHFTLTLNMLRDGLEDHRLVPEGLVRVWKDFVIRFGATFEKFEDYHMTSLKELVDRSVEQGNTGQFSHTRSVGRVDNLSSIEIRQLSEMVMLTVEQDLKSESSEEIVKLTLGPSAVAVA